MLSQQVTEKQNGLPSSVFATYNYFKYTIINYRPGINGDRDFD